MVRCPNASRNLMDFWYLKVSIVYLHTSGKDAPHPASPVIYSHCMRGRSSDKLKTWVEGELNTFTSLRNIGLATRSQKNCGLFRAPLVLFFCMHNNFLTLQHNAKALRTVCQLLQSGTHKNMLIRSAKLT